MSSPQPLVECWAVGGALEAPQVDASKGRLTADVTGEVETEEGVLVICRIHVRMYLVASEEVKERVERVHELTRCDVLCIALCTKLFNLRLLYNWLVRRRSPEDQQ